MKKYKSEITGKYDVIIVGSGVFDPGFLMDPVAAGN